MGGLIIKTISAFLFGLLLIALVHAGDPESVEEPGSVRFGMQGKITAVEGKGDELAQIMLQASRVVSTMDGCELYIVQQSMSDESVILISEVWRDRESHQASLSDERVQELIARARPIIAGMEGHPAHFVGGHGLRKAGGQH